MQYMTERSLQIPLDAPPKLVRDIESYSALVEMQAKMGSVSPWFMKLS